MLPEVFQGMRLFSGVHVSVFSLSAPFAEAVEIVDPFVSSDVVFALVGLVPQVQLLE